MVFAINGSFAAWVAKPITAFFHLFSPESMGPWVYYPIRILLIFPIYQLTLPVVGFIFGQFKFFWEFEKKFLSIESDLDSYFKNNIVVRKFLSKEEIDLSFQNSQSYLTNTAFINHFEGLNKEEIKPIYISHPKGHLFGHIIKLSGKKIGNYYAREKLFSLKRILFRPISLRFFCFGNTHLSNVNYNINTEKLNLNELSDIIDVIQKKHDITFFLFLIIFMVS